MPRRTNDLSNQTVFPFDPAWNRAHGRRARADTGTANGAAVCDTANRLDNGERDLLARADSASVSRIRNADRTDWFVSADDDTEPAANA